MNHNMTVPSSVGSKRPGGPTLPVFAFASSSFSLPALLRLATSLRHGQPCTVDTTQRPVSGSLNWILIVRFDDGVEWVFRAPKQKGHLPVLRTTALQLLASEIVTLQYIRANTTIPVADVFHYSTSADNDIGVPYMLMSKIAGRPLGDRGWPTHDLSLPLMQGPHRPPAAPGRLLTLQDKAKVMRQLGSYACQLYCLRLPVAGALLSVPGDESRSSVPVIGRCLTPGFVLQGRDTLVDDDDNDDNDSDNGNDNGNDNDIDENGENDIDGDITSVYSSSIPRGPFTSSTDYYKALTTALQRHAEQLRMNHHLFLAPVPVHQDGYPSFAAFRRASDWWNDVAAALGGRPTEASKNRLHYCLVASLLREAIVPILAAAPDGDSDGDRGFSLCHADLSTQNIFVDSDLRVTGILDWEFCTAVPPAQLLAVPGMPHPRDLVCGQDEPGLREAYRTGFTEEYTTMQGGVRGHHLPPLPTDWEWTVGTAVAHFLRLVHLDALQDYYHLSALVDLLRVCDNDNDNDNDDATQWIARTMAAQQETAQAKAWAVELAADNVPASKSEKEEAEYFTAINAPERLTAARKLAVCASIRPWQVLDRRLWHWLAAVYKWKEDG